MKRNWLVLIIALFVAWAVFIIVRIAENTSPSKPTVIHTIHFPGGEKIEIYQLEWTGLSTITPDNPKKPLITFAKSHERAVWGGGHCFEKLTTHINNKKWNESTLETFEPTMVLIARAFDDSSGCIVSQSVRSFDLYGEDVKEIKFNPANRTFDEITEVDSSLDWSIEFDIGNGGFHPFNGPLTASAADGKAFNWQPFTPASQLRLRGRIGSEISEVIEIDVSSLKTPVVLPIDSIPVVRNMADFNFKISDVKDVHPSFIDCEFQSIDPNQDQDSWNTSRIVVGDNLGNRSNRFQYLALPDATQLFYEFTFNRSRTYHWHESEVEIIAEGIIPESADMSSPKSFSKLKLSPVQGFESFEWESINLSLSEQWRDKISSWRVNIVGKANSADLEKLLNESRCVVFVDGDEYSIGESDVGRSGGSTSAFNVAEFDYKLTWHGNLKPGQRIRFGIAYNPPDQHATFAIPRAQFSRIKPPAPTK